MQGPDQLWVADITYVAIAAGFVYLRGRARRLVAAVGRYALSRRQLRGTLRRQSDPGRVRKTIRHRLNRGGDRAANSALHIIAIGHLRTNDRTKAYVARRIADGHSKLEAIRCLKTLHRPRGLHPAQEPTTRDQPHAIRRLTLKR